MTILVWTILDVPHLVHQFVEFAWGYQEQGSLCLEGSCWSSSSWPPAIPGWTGLCPDQAEIGWSVAAAVISWWDKAAHLAACLERPPSGGGCGRCDCRPGPPVDSDWSSWQPWAVPPGRWPVFGHFSCLKQFTTIGLLLFHTAQATGGIIPSGTF